MWISSITQSFPLASSPNSYLVSTRMRPLCRAQACPAVKRSSAMRDIPSHCLCVTVPRAINSLGEIGSSCLPTSSLVLGVRMALSNF